jgi:putative transposase
MRRDPDLFHRHWFRAEVIGHAVWLYIAFSLSLRGVDLLLAERGITVSHAGVRQWCGKFDQTFANELRRRRPKPDNEWHLDEVFIRIRAVRHCLSRGGRGGGSPRYPRPAPPQHQGGQAVLAQALERAALRPSGDRHRQAAELRCGKKGDPQGRRASTEPASQQSGRELAPTDATRRATDGTVQVAAASAAFPFC